MNKNLSPVTLYYIFILIGPPGAGKTMLAKRLGSILPPLNLYESLETTKSSLYSFKAR
jgi:predicted ATPase with chaperone activity